MERKRKLILLLLGLCLVLFAAGCKKKAPPPPPPPPPPAPVQPPPPPKPNPPTVSFTAEPNSIERGQTVTLRWNTSNADGAEITPGIGAVGANGTRQVTPTETTTYTIVAKGPGGTARATASVTVRTPPPPPPPPPPRDFSSDLARSVQDAYFDFDKFDIRDDARATLTSDATALNNLFRDFPNARVTIEGHCDERGSAEYNLGLGDRRAQATREFLTGLGVSASRLNVVSYGKERPQCTESNETCWQRNRRAHFSAGN